MTLLPKRTLEWMLKVKSSYNFLTKQVKKWDQNVSREKFSLFIVKLKLGFSAQGRQKKKKFQGGKNTKKYTEKTLLSLFQGRGNGKKIKK